MGGFSMMHWIVVAIVVLVLFGRGKISETMGDFGKGIKSFRKGLAEEDTPRNSAPLQIKPTENRAESETPRQAETES